MSFKKRMKPKRFQEPRNTGKTEAHGEVPQSEWRLHPVVHYLG